MFNCHCPGAADLCYDDKLKISTGESVLLGNYGPLPTVVEDEFYSFALQPDAKPANHINGGATITAASAAAAATTTETLMEFDCGNSLELVNHLTPPQTPPQTTAFGGVVGCVLPMQSMAAAAPLLSVPMPQQQQQFQQLYAPMINSQQPPQQLSFSEGNSSEFYIVDEYATITQIGAGGVQQLQQQQQQQQQETVPLVEPLQQVPGFSFSTEGYTPQQMYEMENIVRSLQQQMEEDASSSSQSSCHGGDDDDSCGFSEAGSLESSLVARSPVYSDSAESSAYYGGSGSNRCNDADDEDWSPSKSKKLNQRNGGMVVKKQQQQQQQRTGGSGTTRPYGGRGTEEKKSRKKEQNKNAATRYRQKKKAEIEEILIEESKLRERNEELKMRSQDLGREISCIKKLMREFCKSKGLI
uniref:BZIP domain-containing protein n=1 Tax=Anopheles farauti TaxID=69004 RepID=A0A182QWF8_9DIPT